jgi:hypothetical protein
MRAAYSHALLILFLSAFLLACNENDTVSKGQSSASSSTEKNHTVAAPTARNIDHDLLRRKLIYGKATLAEVRQTLTEKDTGGLTNTMHALYSMRWHRGVTNLLQDMWELNKNKYPELNWDSIAEAPVKIALASTINRMQTVSIKEYEDYIRSHKKDAHEFHRAQVVIALGLNGDPTDVEYIKSMADGDNHYIAQSAITGLSLMNNNKARDALLQLWSKYKGDPRGKLMKEILQQAYNITPLETKTDQAQSIPLDSASTNN